VTDNLAQLPGEEAKALSGRIAALVTRELG